MAGVALSNGLNVAAAFNLKRSEKLPAFVYFMNRKLAVIDGDKTDYRPSDGHGGRIVGLKFKLPHGTNYTQAEKQAFCIA